MKRFFTSLVTFSLVETIGRHPAIAGVLMLLGVGGGAVGYCHAYDTDDHPFISANFNPNQSDRHDEQRLEAQRRRGWRDCDAAGERGRLHRLVWASISKRLSIQTLATITEGWKSYSRDLPSWARYVARTANIYRQRLANGGIPGSQWWLNPVSNRVFHGLRDAGS